MRAPLTAFDGRSFDVAVIGGGINGASAARELAEAGYSVLVVDKGDFGSGASSRSSRLLHCGLRYLAPGRSIFDFVRHPDRLRVALRMAKLAMEARSEFVRAAPSRVTAMRLHFPIYRDGPYRPWQVVLAFRILWGLGPKDLPLDAERLSPEQARQRPLVSGLRDFDRLDAVMAFREYQFDWPERICVDIVCEAEKLGATARNHTKARLLSHAAGAGWTVELTDMREQFAPATVSARSVVVMAGVWIDELLQGAVGPNAARARPAGRKVFGTKGSHIVVKLPDDCAGQGIATLNSRQEPFYCVPWRHLHYFGPTETPYDGDQDRVCVTDEEIGFLLGEANRLLPALRLTRDDIRLTWAGVRPLTYDPATPFGNRSRMLHDLAQDGLPDALAMTAGPVMTHRSAGREIAAALACKLQPGGASAPTADVAHGPAVPGAASGDALRHAETLSDVLFRRTGQAWSGPLSETELQAIAAETADILEWDEDRTLREIVAYRAEVNALFRPGTWHGA